MASLCCVCGREGWSERQKDVSKDQKGRWKKESHMQTFSRLHSPKRRCRRRQATRCATTTEKSSLSCLRLIFKWELDFLRRTETFWGFSFCVSLFEQQHDLFQLQKQLSFPHKMCLLFVDEHFPLCWLKRTTTSRSGGIVLRPFFGRSERQRMMTSKIFQPSKKTTSKPERNSWKFGLVIVFKYVFRPNWFGFGLFSQNVSTDDDDEGWWGKLKSFPFKLFNYVNKQLPQLQWLVLFVSRETQNSKLIVSHLQALSRRDEMENCVRAKKRKLQKNKDVIDKIFYSVKPSFSYRF